MLMHVLATGACTNYNRRRIASVAHTHILLGSLARGLQCCYYGSRQTEGNIISKILFFWVLLYSNIACILLG